MLTTVSARKRVQQMTKSRKNGATMLTRTLLVLTALLLMAPIATHAQTPSEILVIADEQRAPWPSFGLSVAAETNTAARGLQNRTYRVAFKDRTKTLISFETPPTNAGDLVLMNGDDLWFYAKDTRQPIRITPIQKISGSVSYGDIARLSWSLDYTVETLTQTEREGVPVVELSLAAKTKGATYQKITLWVAQDSYRPIAADVFLLSGKLFKTILFTKFEDVLGKTMNTEMTIIDHLKSGESSKLNFSEIEPRDWPNRLFVKTGLANVNPRDVR